MKAIILLSLFSLLVACASGRGPASPEQIEKAEFLMLQGDKRY